MSGWWSCCDCLCPPARVLHRQMVASARAPPASRGVDNAAYLPDQPSADAVRQSSAGAARQPAPQTEAQFQDGAPDTGSQPFRPHDQAGSWSSDPSSIVTTCTPRPASAPSQPPSDQQTNCSRCSNYNATAIPPQVHRPGSCPLDQILEQITEAEDETADGECKGTAGGGTVTADGTDAAPPGPGSPPAAQKRSRLSMFRRRSQPATSHETRRERPWLSRFSRRAHSTGEFSDALTAAAAAAGQVSRQGASTEGEERRRGSLLRRRRSSNNSEASGGREGGTDEDGQEGRRPSRSRRPTMRFGRRRSSKRGSDAGQTATEDSERDDERERELAAAAAAAKRWRRVVNSTFDDEAPLSSHWTFLESVKDSFPKVDVKSYTEHAQHQPAAVSSQSSDDEEVPDPQEAQLMLTLSESKDVHPDKVERRESLRRKSVTKASVNETARHAMNSVRNGDPPVNLNDIDLEHQPPTSRATGLEQKEKLAPVQQPRFSVLSAWFSSQPPSSPERRSSAFSSWFSPQPRASSCPSPSTSAVPADRSESPAPGDARSPQNSAGDGSAPRLVRSSRPSIVDRLFPASGTLRRTSLPVAGASPEARVRAPTWFQQAHEPELPAGGTTPDILKRRRATVAELSLKTFLQEVDARTQALREEEFRTADPYEVLAPEQVAQDDDHVVPIVDSQRCVRLMLEDAERRLQHEYTQESPCSSPDSHETAAVEAAKTGQTVEPSRPSTARQSSLTSKEAKKLKHLVSSILQGTTSTAETSLAMVPYQPIVRNLANHDHHQDISAGPTTSCQHHSSSGACSSEVRCPAIPGPSRIPQHTECTSTATQYSENVTVSARTSTSEKYSQAGQTEQTPERHSKGAQSSLSHLIADPHSQSAHTSTDPSPTVQSQHAQTSTEQTINTQSAQTSTVHKTSDDASHSVQTQADASPQRTHPHSSPVSVDDTTLPNTPQSSTQCVQTLDSHTAATVYHQPSAGEPARLPPDKETAPSALHASCQTPGPSVATSTEEEDQTEGLEEVEGARETTGGLSWEVAVSDPRRALTDRGPPCGIGRQLELSASATMMLKLEKRQLAAARRREEQLRSRSAAMAAGPSGRSAEAPENDGQMAHQKGGGGSGKRRAEGPGEKSAGGPTTSGEGSATGGEEGKDKRKKQRRELRSKREKELTQQPATSSDEEDTRENGTPPGKRRGNATAGNRQASASTDARDTDTPTTSATHRNRTTNGAASLDVHPKRDSIKRETLPRYSQE